jgi:hypothetical protein
MYFDRNINGNKDGKNFESCVKLGEFHFILAITEVSNMETLIAFFLPLSTALQFCRGHNWQNNSQYWQIAPATPRTYGLYRLLGSSKFAGSTGEWCHLRNN